VHLRHFFFLSKEASGGRHKRISLVDGERTDAVIVAGPHYSFACSSLPGGLVSSFDLNQGLAVCPSNVSNR
jgi:hypothetical protein